MQSFKSQEVCKKLNVLFLEILAEQLHFLSAIILHHMHYLIKVDIKKPLFIQGTDSHSLLLTHSLGYFSNMKLVTFGKQQFYYQIIQVVQLFPLNGEHRKLIIKLTKKTPNKQKAGTTASEAGRAQYACKFYEQSVILIPVSQGIFKVCCQNIMSIVTTLLLASCLLKI